MDREEWLLMKSTDDAGGVVQGFIIVLQKHRNPLGGSSQFSREGVWRGIRESTLRVFGGALVDQRCPRDREKVLMR